MPYDDWGYAPARHARRAPQTRRRVLFWLAAALFVAAAVGLGIFLTDRMVVPFMESGAAQTQRAGSQSVLVTMPPGETGQSVTEKIEIPAWTIYGVQVGAYNVQENAQSAADALKPIGGAGYIVEDGMKRVLAAGFASEQDAKTVGAQLHGAKDMYTEVYPLSCGALAFKMTATKTHIEAVRAALSAWKGYVDEAEQIVRALDSGQATGEETQARLGALQEKLAGTAAQLHALPGSVGNDFTSALYKMYASAAETAGVIAKETVRQGEPSARVKALQLDMAWQYRLLVQTLAQ
nr:SPOR domain-containing protein [Maliibacterium massiliense]